MPKSVKKVWGKKEILNTRGKQKRELVDLPGDEGSVWCQEITGTERDAFENSVTPTDKKDRKLKESRRDNMRARLIQLGAIDAEGNKLFNSIESDELAYIPSSISSCLFDAICRLSGITEKDLEDMEKNSESGPSAGS